MYPQHLPIYTHTFLDYPDWRAVESTHYIFNYTKGSEAEREIQHIIHTQEEDFTRILDFLKNQKPGGRAPEFLIKKAEIKYDLRFCRTVTDQARGRRNPRM